MQPTISGLMDRYRNADGNTRLHLYLQYPELRTEFIEIERSELGRKPKVRTASAGCVPWLQKSPLFAAMAGCMGRLCRGPERKAA